MQANQRLPNTSTFFKVTERNNTVRMQMNGQNANYIYAGSYLVIQLRFKILFARRNLLLLVKVIVIIYINC